MEILTNPQENIKDLLKFSNLTPRVQSHLVKVYFAMTLALAAFFASSFLAVYLNLGIGIGAIGFISMFALLLAFTITPKSNRRLRTGFLIAIASLKGLFVAPLISVALSVDPNILVTAIVGTCGIFLCFTVSALISKKRSYLYLGGILSSALFLIFLISIVNTFVNSEALFNIELYGGLLLFCFYIPYDTQMIILRTERGDFDYAGHALTLFTDFVAVFVRIMLVLLRNKQKKKDEDKKE